ncbi:MAG TPA: endonuclease/exonuclease/phosphatase family protein [Acidimicrobiia bacterium]|nr:endonuclease/exonuclease/phosphatase family protein [Acidimicrobiia bacterium]
MSLLAVAPSSAYAAKAPTITVMTRNVYYGADLRPLAVTAPGAPFWQLATKMFNTMRSEDPAGRMKLVAGEIAKAKPDVVGLQEVATWRTGPQPASKVEYDFLKLITRELKRLHQSYKAVAVEQGLDIEGPMAEGNDVRLTMGDVVLVRNGVKVSHVRSGLFKNQLVIPTQAIGTVNVGRGYNQMDVTKQGVTVHVVNTHLEAFSAPIRLTQANELVAGPTQSKKTTILVGDLNAGPTGPKPEDIPPYTAITTAGFVASRTADHNCCYKGVRDSNQAHWDHDGDWIMTKPARIVVKSYTVGTETTAAGIHPGDHGGVVSVLDLTG